MKYTTLTRWPKVLFVAVCFVSFELIGTCVIRNKAVDTVKTVDSTWVCQENKMCSNVKDDGGVK